MWKVALIGLATTMMLSATASAQEACSPPTPPQIPASLTDDAQTETKRLEVVAYLGAWNGFAECLKTEFEKLDEPVTDETKAAFRTAHDDAFVGHKAMSEAWNAVYGPYLQAQAQAATESPPQE